MTEFRKCLPLGFYDVLMVDSIKKPGAIEVYLTRDRSLQKRNVDLLLGMPEVETVEQIEERSPWFRVTLKDGRFNGRVRD